MIRFLLCFLATLLVSHAHAQPTVLKENSFSFPLAYTVFSAIDSITIDGNHHETSWKTATWSSYFVDIEGDEKPSPRHHTRFKMLWNSSYVYLLFILEEPHVWATLKNHDDVIFHDNDIEIFIDPDGDGQNYFEIEVNAFKTVFDLFLSKPYRNGGSALIPWDCKGIHVGISIDGTLNDPTDIDKSWMVEMAIPFNDISLGNHVHRPHEGTTWRMNFSRVQWDTEVVNGRYQRMRDHDGNLLPEHNWVWSPQGVVNMHLPERWGYVVFTDTRVGETYQWHLSSTEKAKAYLWNVYYQQMLYKRKHGFFAKGMKNLRLEKQVVIDHIPFQLHLEGTRTQFISYLKNMSTNEVWELNHRGEIQMKH